jgi:hypothetical protein
MSDLFALPALLSLLLIVHVCLVFMTGHSSFWWLARLLDAIEAAERATAFCLLPWWRRWRRQFRVEQRRLSANA